MATPVEPPTGKEVMLHVYDVTNAAVTKYINKVFKDVSGVGGAFHGAVEVYGKEWSFGYSSDGGTGIFHGEPRKCGCHQYKESIPLGITTLSEEEVNAVLKRMEPNWMGHHYDLLGQNCCSFSNAFALELGVAPIPSWVNRFAGVGNSARGFGSSAVGEANRAMTQSGIKGTAGKVKGFLSKKLAKPGSPQGGTTPQKDTTVQITE